MLFFFVPANVTFHIAAPHEVASALFFDLYDPRLVTSTATKKPAAVDPWTRPVAHSASRAQDVEPGKM